MARFGRVLTAMVTPFGDDGDVDLDGAAELARWLVDNGNDALVLAGTTGESPVISDEERLALFRAVRAAVEVPLVAGCTTNDTAHSVELTGASVATGIDAVLAVTPYYNKPTQAGLDAHFRAVASAAGEVPVMLYDVPGRTGRAIEAATVLRLAREVPNVVALKDAGGQPAATAALIAEAPEGFEVYSGDEPLTLALLAYGAVGVVGVSSHWTGTPQSEMVEAFLGGDHARAAALNASLLPSYAYMNSDTCVFSQAVKAMLAHLGLPGGQCRLPLGPAPSGTEAAAADVAAALGLRTPQRVG